MDMVFVDELVIKRCMSEKLEHRFSIWILEQSPTRARRSAALYCLDQDGLVERFEQVVCSPEVANSLSVAGLVVAGNANDRHPDAHGKHRLKHIEPRRSRHLKGQQHAVRTVRLDRSSKI